MHRIQSILLGVLTAVAVSGCATPESASGGQAIQGLVGSWIVAASRPGGEGVVLATFLSDGTFIRSGDTHPVLSAAHGTWKRAGGRDFDATYIALRFDNDKKYIGTQKTRIRITQGSSVNEFTGVARVQILDPNGKEERASETRLVGKRIEVEPF